MGSLVLVLVLVAGVAVVLVANRNDEGSEEEKQSTSEKVREQLLNDARTELPTTVEVEEATPGYDYSTPISGVGVDDDLIIAASYEADATDPWQGDPGVLEVYADAALTQPVPISILPDLTTPTSAPHLSIKAMELRRTQIVREDGKVTGRLTDLGTYWNLNPHVYVVQYLEPDGTERERALVTEVDFVAETAAPAQVASSITTDGDAFLEWTPVEGASEYLVVLQQRRADSDTVQVVGRTTEPTWTSAASAQCRTTSCTQNDAMKLTTIDASTLASLPSLATEEVDARLGVIAVVDGQRSVVAPITFDGLESLPVRADLKWDAEADLAGDGFAALPSRFLFVSIDGSTRATGAYVDHGEVTRQGTDWVVPLRGRGTRLVQQVRIPATAVSDLDAAVVSFNDRSLRDYPPAGLDATEIVIDTDQPRQPGAELPPPDYPVFGSNPLTIFIAEQLIAGNTVIDVSALADQPGAPDVEDALNEAIYQNPYTFAHFDRFSLGDDVIHVEPAYTEDEKQRRRSAVEDAVERVVASEVTDAMSVAEKVDALNRYLVDTADYDHPALAARDRSSTGVPPNFRYAWETDGILLDGSGVCMSYAYAFQALAEEAGLESVVVTGDLADGGRHAWNKVRTGDTWRAVDVTWNDPQGPWSASSGTRYLMIIDSQFTDNALRSEDHYWMADAYLDQYATR